MSRFGHSCFGARLSNPDPGEQPFSRV